VRWYGLWKETPLEDRKQLLRSGALLAKGAAQLLSTGRTRASFMALASDMELDLAGLAPPGSEERARWLDMARADLRGPEQVDMHLEPVRPLAFWRVLRLAALGDDEQATRKALKAFRKALKKRGNGVKTYAHFFKNDPLGDFLRRKPKLGKLLDKLSRGRKP
jgi:hypothetical protein